MATDEEFTVDEATSGLEPEVASGGTEPAPALETDLGESSKFSSVEVKSSECWGLSIERDSSVLKKIEVCT